MQHIQPENNENIVNKKEESERQCDRTTERKKQKKQNGNAYA